MAGGIRIPVSADVDQLKAQVEQVRRALNDLGRTAAQAGGMKFKPVDRATVEDVRRLRQEFESLMRVSPGLRRRIAGSGQSGAEWHQLDWGKMFPDAGQRGKYQQQMLRYMSPGLLGHAPVPPVPQQPRGAGLGGAAGSALGGIAQAGLRGASGATGGVGGVAAGALGTGMQAGFGAGLAGLIGGIAALAVGRAVGAVVEKVGAAEDLNINLDRLKRQVGDVSVSFSALKAAVHGAADANKIQFAEAEKLSTQFAKLGNLSGEKAVRELPGELSTSVGLARGFGLDLDQSTGVLGRMRGLGVTRSEQDTRRFALLIGETIGKAGAFSKADEVLEAIGNYATLQTRSGLSVAGVEGFGAFLSSLVGSKTAGLDVTKASNMLGAANASLMRGGAKGEASQFYSAKVGNRLGLSPIEVQALNEAGAFGTVDSALGKESVWARFTGKQFRGNGKTTLENHLDEIRRDYGHDKGLMAQATANHLGIGLNDAAALLMARPGQLGEMSKYGDLKNMRAGGIANLSSALYGSDDDRRSLANSLARRTGEGALSADELQRLDGAMRGGNVETQKRVLAELVASRDQERTIGSDVRDSKALLENVKVALADKLVPLTNEMRLGILALAGVGRDGVTSHDVMRRVVEADSAGRKAAIDGRYATRHQALADRRTALRTKIKAGTATVEEQREFAEKFGGGDAAFRALGEEKARELGAERARLQKELEEAGLVPGAPAAAAGTAPASGGDRYGARLGEVPAAATATDVSLANRRGYRNNNPGNLEASVQWAGMVGSDGRFARFESAEMGYRAMGKNLLGYQSKHGLNTVRGIISRWAPPGENNTQAYIDKISKELGVGPDDQLDLREQKTLQRLMTGIARHENGGLLHGQDVIGRGAGLALGTPMPEDAARAAHVSRPDPVSVGPLSGEMSLALDLTPEARRLLQGPQAPMSTRFGSSRSFGVAA